MFLKNFLTHIVGKNSSQINSVEFVYIGCACSIYLYQNWMHIYMQNCVNIAVFDEKFVQLLFEQDYFFAK